MNAICFTKSARGFSFVAGILLAIVSSSSAQTATSNSFPVVTVVATQPFATAANPGVFTVFRAGNTNAALHGVWYNLTGTASNGVDYAMISPHLMTIPAGATSSNIVIAPLTNLPSSVVKTVVLTLTNSPMMYPVNFGIGSPSSATIFILPAGTTNLPPSVNLVYPTNGAVVPAPANIPLLARAFDPAGTPITVEFFSGTNDLGRGLPVVLDPPGVGGVVGPVYFLTWTNVPAGGYSLTAVATGSNGLSAVSTPVSITVQARITNLPPVVRITSPPNGAVFRAPVNIPLYAFAADPGGPVTSVEFFAASNSLGLAHPVAAVPPPLLPGGIQPPILIVVSNYWELVWTNPPLGTNIVLTAKATDNGGASTFSPPVSISILAPTPPPTNRPALVSIVATDPVAIEGTNCWRWPVWSNWVAPTAVTRFLTNCGPKNATFTVFRMGATNDNLNVNYLIGGTATNGIDYVALPGVVLIPSSQRQAVISVVPLDDGPPDVTSIVILKVIPGTNYLVGSPATAAAIILDSQSPHAATGVLPGQVFHVNAAGPDGAWFHVEYTTDMLHWTAVCTNQVVNGGIDFVDPAAASQPARYYRTVPEAGPPPQ